MRILDDLDTLADLTGEELGTSDWLEIDQDREDRFADATGDHQWIHIDPERATAGPFGGPIAHGYLTLSLAPVLLGEVVVTEGVSMGVNYGLNKLRFPSPVPVGKRLRMGAQLKEVTDIAGGAQSVYELTFEVEGQDKPACVAEAVYRVYA